MPLVSIVMPCLNEEAVVGWCVERAALFLTTEGLDGEVLVCDNRSEDNSALIASQSGARVVIEGDRGYGNACRRAFAEATGSIIILGDSDGSFDFVDSGILLDPIIRGTYEFVVGSRTKGSASSDAFPWTHRRIGVPLLTAVLNQLHGLDVSDAHTGVKALTVSAIDKLGLRSSGFELTTEMEIRGARVGLRRVEVPINSRKRVGRSKLRPLRDGLRHLIAMTASPGR